LYVRGTDFVPVLDFEFLVLNAEFIGPLSMEKTDSNKVNKTISIISLKLFIKYALQL
jgi:hypothetical protein